MKKSTKPLGNRGEKLAAEFLQKKNYRILGHNLNLRYAEADLIAQDGETIVLVEVKTTTGHQFLYPQELVHARKQHKLLQLAKMLSQEYPGKAIRIDVVAIEMSDQPQITHIENAVEG